MVVNRSTEVRFLDRLFVFLFFQVFYKPEEFIGLSWITNDNGIKIVFVIFSTGNIVATGLKSMEQIPIAEERMHRLIAPFRRGNEPASYDSSHPHMRDSATLHKIKSELFVDAYKNYQHSKANAAERNSKKLWNEVRALMKQIEIDVLPGDDSMGDAAAMGGGDQFESEAAAAYHFDEIDASALPLE